MKTTATIRRISIFLACVISTGLLPLSTEAACTAPPSGLVSWWRGEGDVTDVANLNNGTTNGSINYTNGRVGQSIAFNGSSYVSFGSLSNLNIGVTGSGVTIEGWIKPGGSGQGMPVIEWIRPGSGGLQLWVESGFRLFGNVEDTNGNSHVLITASGTLNSNVLQHVALTYDKTSGLEALYINGIQVATQNIGTVTPMTSAGMNIGFRTFTGATYIGLIDELSIYNRGLNSNEIAAIYTADSAGKCLQVTPTCTPPPSGLVGWWKGEGSGFDSTTNNTGTVLGTSSYLAGEVGQGFGMDGVNGTLQIPASPSLNVGLANGFTIEAWIYPSNTSPQPIFEWSQYPNNGNYESGLWTGHPFYPTCNLYGFIFEINNTAHELFSFGPLASGFYEHVAMTYDKASGLGRLFINGVKVTETSVGTFTPKTLDNLYLGSRPPGDPYSRVLQGRIDEATLYNRALTTNEIAAIFSAGSAGKCPLPLVGPTIVTQPTNFTTLTGGSASFSVVAQGSGPLFYQWRQNGTNLPAGTNAILALANVQVAQAGNYSVLVSNPVTNIMSSNATLTVIPICTAPPSGLVSWWSDEGDLSDLFNLNNGTTNGPTAYTGGKVGQAIVFNGSNYISFSPAASLNIGATGSGVTIEGWIKPGGSGQGMPVIEWVRPGTGGLQLWVESSFRLFGNVEDTNGNSHALITSSGVLNSNVFQHVALTYDKTSGLEALYINGVQVATQNIGVVTPMTSAGMNIGLRTFTSQTYIGQIDELSIYNRGLSSNEIAAIYIADSAGKCVPQCTPPPSGLVSWWKGEGSSLDQIGTNNGILEGNLTYTNGLVGTAFSFNATNADVKIPASSTINVGLSSGFTVESWIKLANVSARSPIFEWNNGAGALGVHLWASPDNPGELFANVVSAGGGTFTFRSAAGLVQSNVYQHTALTYNKTSGVAIIYLNGAAVAQRNVGSYTPQTSYNLYLGRRISGVPGDLAGLVGTMDEPSIYNRALSSNEIAAIFLSGSLGKCNPDHPPIAAGPFTIGVTLGVPSTVKIIGGKHAPTDPDNDQLVITGVSGAANGNTTTDGTNVTYAATGGGATDSFVCSVSDLRGGTAQQTVNVIITSDGLGYNLLSVKSLGGGTNLLTFLGTPSFNYALERATNLVVPIAWLPLTTNIAATNGWLIFTDVTSLSPVFYRTRYVP